jgi:hypothetical protein
MASVPLRALRDYSKRVGLLYATLTSELGQQKQRSPFPLHQLLGVAVLFYHRNNLLIAIGTADMDRALYYTVVSFEFKREQ